MKLIPSALIAAAVSAAAAMTTHAAGPDLTKLPPPSDKKNLTYATDIKPILEASCVKCHGGDRVKGGLHVDSLEGLLKGGEDGKVVIPGKSQDSPLVIAVAQIDEDTAMPPKRGPGGGGGGRGGPGGAGGPGGRGPGNLLAMQLVAQGDKDGDKRLTKEELTGIAGAWFDKMDTAHAGKLTREQFSLRFANVMGTPPVQPGGGGQGAGGAGGGQGGGGGQRRGPAGGGGQRGGGAGGPGGQGGGGGAFGGRFVGQSLVTAVDADKDNTVTKTEMVDAFGKWFDEADADKSGSIAEEQLAAGLNKALPQPTFGGGGGQGGPGGGGPGGAGAPGGGGGGAGGANGGGGGGRRGGFGGGGGPGGGGGQPAKPLTPEQVGIVRAWIDQGAK